MSKLFIFLLSVFIQSNNFWLTVIDSMNVELVQILPVEIVIVVVLFQHQQILQNRHGVLRRCAMTFADKTDAFHQQEPNVGVAEYPGER